MKAILAAAAAALIAASPAAAQTCRAPAVTFQDFWCAQIAEVRKVAGQDGAVQAIQQAISLQGGNLGAFLLFAQSRSQIVDLRQIEDARTDKQVGAPGNAAGSSSVVSKGSVPGILGFAVENGALTQTTSDTTVTLRGNLVGWLDLIQNQGFIASYQDDSGFVRQLRRISYSLTLNTDSTVVAASDAAGGLSPDAIRQQLQNVGQQLTGYSVRAALLDRRDPRTAANRASVATLAGAMNAALKAQVFLDDTFNSDQYRKLFNDTATKLNDASLSHRAMETVLYRQLEAIRLLMVSRIPAFDEQVAKALLELEGFDKARLKVFQAMQKRPLMAFEYINARAKDLPDTSTLRFIAEGQWGPRINLTANVSMAIRHAAAGATAGADDDGGVRDFQAAAQLDIPLASAAKTLGSAGGIGTPVFGVAYLSQKLYDKATVAFAGQAIPLEPGWIHAVQARVTIPVKGSGVKVPLSLSFANRTELIKEKTLRGHIGVTFDMDVLASLRK